MVQSEAWSKANSLVVRLLIAFPAHDLLVPSKLVPSIVHWVVAEHEVLRLLTALR